MRHHASRVCLTVALIATLLTALALVGTVPAKAAPAVTNISGTVTVPAGVDAGLVEVWAVVDNAYEPQQTTMLNPDGSYGLSGLPPGGYRLKFTGRSGAQEQWYNNASSIQTSDVVTVTDGQQRTGINARLVKGGTISGTLTAAAGVSLAATRIHSSASEGSWPVAADGTYKIVGLRAGSYTLWFSGDGNALAQYYNNAPSSGTATAITVAEGRDVTGINSNLKKGASISGSVTAPAGVTLSATRVAATISGERSWTGLTTVAADGSYRLSGLPAGEYIVDFSVSGALAQWYSAAASWRTATAVSVAEGQDVTGIDAALLKAASISGTVTVPPGVDSGKVMISAYSARDLSSPVTWTWPAADGSYTLSYLPAGSYRIEFASVRSTEFQGQDSGALVEWFNNAASSDDAAVIVLGTGEELTGVNATLVKGASISGSVKAPDAIGEYKTTVSLYASDAPGVAIESSYIVADDPTYAFTGLPAGSYKVGFPVENNEAQSQWFANSDSFETASVITVSEGQDVAGIDAILAKTVTPGAPTAGTAPATLTSGETVAGVDARRAPEAAPAQVPWLNEAGLDVTHPFDSPGEATGDGGFAVVAEPRADGTVALAERGSGAASAPNPAASTSESSNHSYPATGWFALAAILIAAIAAAAFQQRRRRFPLAR